MSTFYFTDDTNTDHTLWGRVIKWKIRQLKSFEFYKKTRPYFQIMCDQKKATTFQIIVT